MTAPFDVSAFNYLQGTVPFNERAFVKQPRSDPSIYNNPSLALGSNFGKQDGDRRYPVQYTYARHNAGRGFMYDTRDFVNHNLDSRSNDYNPRLIPDASAYGGFQTAEGFQRPNPNGTTNAFNPPDLLHGLPPTISSKHYFMQS